MTPQASLNHRKILEDLWRTAVSAVGGDRAIASALRADQIIAADQVIAIGKAACAMCSGALSILRDATPALVISKQDCPDALCKSELVRCIRGNHPVPGRQSLDAGRNMLETVRKLGPDTRLLLLVSGGASSLAEVPIAGIDLSELQQLNERLQASGNTIAELNEARAAVSAIKGGKLLQHFAGSEVRTYAISDVEGDSIELIGSGIGSVLGAKCRAFATLVATNTMARQVAADAAIASGLTLVANEETLYGDVTVVADRLAESLKRGGPGVYIWGGEPTIKLPQESGTGGRNQSLALRLALRLKGSRGVSVLIGGTDGDDGNSGVAGAFVDGNTVDDNAAASRAFDRADAGTYFRHRAAVFDSGDTHTNVMDLAIAIVGEDATIRRT